MTAYKRIFALTLSLLLLFSLAACAVQPGEDYADFVPPEETDTLVIYASTNSSDVINNAITLFKRNYPDINVEYRRDYAQDDAGNTSLDAELAAGDGPDIIVDYGHLLFNDLHTFKMMENGIYADLAPFFEWDDEIDLADYNEAVLNAGIYMGHRYMVPLSFDTNIWITTQEVLDEAGLDIGSGQQDFTKVMDMLRVFKQENPDHAILYKEYGPAGHLWHFCPYSGAEAVNVEDRQITVDTAQFRAVLDAYKDVLYVDDWVNKTWAGAPRNAVGLLNHETLFYCTLEMFSVADFYTILKSTQTPVLVNCPSFDGKVIGEPEMCAFIREGSPNQLNAWRFLKILLSEELQADNRNYSMNYPVLRSAMKTKLTYDFSMLCDHGTTSTEYGTLIRTEATEEEIDEIISVIYEVDDCRSAPLLGWVSGYMDPYFSGESSYESCLQTLEDKLMLVLNE